MKTKELIRLLQEADPSGELECNCGGSDIYVVERLPGYYDGPYEVLLRDESSPYYNVIGAKLSRAGEKVILKTLSIEEAIENSIDFGKDLALTCEGLDQGRVERFLTWVEEVRAAEHDLLNKIDREHFVKYAAKRFPTVSADWAAAFWSAHYTHATKFPSDIAATWKPTDDRPGTSEYERHEMMWDREVGLKDGALVYLGRPEAS